MSERTLAMIKPDAVERRLAGRIIQRIEESGLQIRAIRRIHLSRGEAEGFYAVHRERPFFASLTAFMSSGPAIVLVLEAPDAIRKWRTLMGATDPARADDGTLRSDVPADDVVSSLIGIFLVSGSPEQTGRMLDLLVAGIAH